MAGDDGRLVANDLLSDDLSRIERDPGAEPVLLLAVATAVVLGLGAFPGTAETVYRAHGIHLLSGVTVQRHAGAGSTKADRCGQEAARGTFGAGGATFVSASKR